MIGPETLSGYGFKDGMAVIVFTDGRELKLVPEWRGDRVRCVTKAMLFEHNDLVAVAGSSGFWTAGEISQQVMGQYCAFAIDIERQVYRFYRQKKIDEQTWQHKFRTFWKIAMKCQTLILPLQSASLPVVQKMEWEGL
jgi:hypothetical protein